MQIHVFAIIYLYLCPSIYVPVVIWCIKSPPCQVKMPHPVRMQLPNPCQIAPEINRKEYCTVRESTFGSYCSVCAAVDCSRALSRAGRCHTPANRCASLQDAPLIRLANSTPSVQQKAFSPTSSCCIHPCICKILANVVKIISYVSFMVHGHAYNLQ